MGVGAATPQNIHSNGQIIFTDEADQAVGQDVAAHITFDIGAGNDIQVSNGGQYITVLCWNTPFICCTGWNVFLSIIDL